MFRSKCIQGGQIWRYGDSVYQYDIESDLPEEEVLSKCLSEVHKCKRSNVSAQHSGACNFPFGLDNFYSFGFVGEDRYRYTVTEPYCD